MSTTGKAKRPRTSAELKALDGADLVFLFCDAVDRLQAGIGEGPSSALLFELRDRLLLTLGPNRIETDEALRVRRKRGAPAKSFEHFEIAAQVQALVDGGMTAEAAFENVAASLPPGKADDRTGHVRNIYQRADKDKVRRLRAALSVARDALRTTRRDTGDGTS